MFSKAGREPMTLVCDPHTVRRARPALPFLLSINGGNSRARTLFLGLSGVVAAISLTLSVPAVAATPGAASEAGARAASGACSPKQATIKGKAVIVNCGPATAKVEYNGKTYSFKDGTCETVGTQVTIDLGTSLIDQGDGNGGFTYAALTIFSSKQPMQVYAFSGKVSVSGSGKWSGTRMKGSFSGKAIAADGVSVSGKTLTGTWNCG
jgi:hypothetical protein